MKHDTELREAEGIRRALDQSIGEIDTAIVARLAQAREAALSNLRQEAGMRLAGRHGDIGHALAPRWRVAFALLGLTFGILSAYYWNPFDQNDDRSDELAEVDSALLSDDIPVDAYADQGFQAWLEHTSASQPSP